VDTWTKVRDVSETINKAARDCLSGKGYLVEVSKLEVEACELLKTLKKAVVNSVEDPNDMRKKLPPPLVRPRRHRRKKNGETVEEDDTDTTEKQQKRKAIATTDLYCHSCGITDTPEWRRGPDGCKSLCNACGLHYAKILKRETMVPNRQTQKNSMSMNNLLN